MPCWLHHCTLQEPEASADRSQVYRSEQENLMSSSSQDPIGTRKPFASFSSKKKLNQETFFRQRRIFQKKINRFLGATNLSSDSSTQQMLRNLFLRETEIICLVKRDLNSRSRNTKWNLLALASVTFSG